MTARPTITSFEGTSSYTVAPLVVATAPSFFGSRTPLSSQEQFGFIVEELSQTNDKLRGISMTQIQRLCSIKYDDELVINDSTMGMVEIIEFLMNDTSSSLDESIDKFEAACNSKSHYLWKLPEGSRLKRQLDFEVELSGRKSGGITSNIPCPRCGGNQVQYAEKQIRRADEPATAMLFCIKCRKPWIIG